MKSHVNATNRRIAGALRPNACAGTLLLLAGASSMLAGCLGDAIDAEKLEDGMLAETSLDITQLPPETLSQDFLNDVLRVFPSGSPPIADDPDFVDNQNGANPNVLIQSNDTESFVTFVRRDSQYNNGIGYFTYLNGFPPATLPSYTVIWPSTADLAQGTRVSLGKFNTGTRIGLVLLVPDGQAAGQVTKYPSIGALNDGSHFVSKYHKAEQRFVMGMEDMPLSAGDKDMNDLIVAISTNPACVSTPEVCDGKDNDCDGVTDEYACRTGFHRYLRSTPQGWVHFYTSDPAEALPGDTLEAWNFFYLVNPSPGTRPFYRCSNGSAFLYTMSPTCELLNKQPEKMIGYIGNPSSPAASQPPGAWPLYRAYSPSSTNQFYTTSEGEYTSATQPPYDYVKVGIAGYVWLTPSS